jgi:hypothetical protein
MAPSRVKYRGIAWSIYSRDGMPITKTASVPGRWFFYASELDG